MIYILPIEVPGYIIPFIIKECPGSEIISEEGSYYTVDIEQHSILGMFLRRGIKPNYKIKNYRMTLYTKKIGDKVAYSTEILEFQNSAQYTVDLTFQELEAFYKFIDHWFRSNLLSFIRGFLAVNKEESQLKKAIDFIIEKYDLLEYGYNYQQIRNLYYDYEDKGIIANEIKNNPLPRMFF